MTQNRKKFEQIINQVFANVNNVMRMCHTDVAIASMDEQFYTYSFGDEYVAVTACIDCEDFEYVSRFTIAKLGSERVEVINVYSTNYMEGASYIYATIYDMLRA